MNIMLFYCSVLSHLLLKVLEVLQVYKLELPEVAVFVLADIHKTMGFWCQ